MSRKTRLELTWIGKEIRPKLEPRILIEERALSHHAAVRKDGDQFDNMLIHGDNLLALKALETEYARKIKCIYIDPPFNTQQAFENYDDGVEHSLWLTLMRSRLVLLKELLTDDGTLFVHIDDNEVSYLTVLLDEIFERKNRCFIITFKQGSATGHKSINKGCVSTTNYILIYAKDKTQWNPNRIYTARDRDKRYNQFIENFEEPFEKWRFVPLFSALAKSLGLDEKSTRAAVKKEKALIDDFVFENQERVVRLARPDYDAVSKDAQKLIDISRSNKGKVFLLEREKHSDMFFFAGERILFYINKMKEVDGEEVSGEPLTTLWDDILSNNLHAEGGVDFPKGKKPEALIKRCIELSTRRDSGDIVLDSFAGSGTTGAVAHKMRRRWIMIEQGEHCRTHAHPRLVSVIEGRDPQGITNSVGWRGGGGFRFYRLAPSLLAKDRYGNWVISKEYNAAMLAEAVCKLMGFTYAPSQDDVEYWRHGHSTETDFIYVTTQSLTHDALKKLSDEVGPKRTLLICCKAFNSRDGAFDNRTIRKIPPTVLSKCEWGRDDYSLTIANLPIAPEAEGTSSAEPASESTLARGKGRKKSDSAPSLFDDGEA